MQIKAAEIGMNFKVLSLSLGVMLLQLSCNNNRCGDFNYSKGWNYRTGVYIDSANRANQLFFVGENCFANGMSILFYKNGVIKEYGNNSNGKRIGRWFTYDTLGVFTGTTFYDK